MNHEWGAFLEGERGKKSKANISEPAGREEGGNGFRKSRGEGCSAARVEKK
jgi:hypothetical protein